MRTRKHYGLGSSHIGSNCRVRKPSPVTLQLITRAELIKEKSAEGLPSSDLGVFHSIGRADYFEEQAAARDASSSSESKLKLPEAARSVLEAGRVRVDFLEREQIYEQKADARARQREEMSPICNWSLSANLRSWR